MEHGTKLSSQCGRQVVTNSLIAYWAFQAWGNDPDAYYNEFAFNMTNYLKRRVKDKTADDDIAQQAFEDFIWHFNRWSFAAPTNPLTLFLDCRTQRCFDTNRGPPQLLSKEALASILNIAQRTNYRKGDPIIIVSPTPVFGFELAEGVQEFLARISGNYKWDLETWAANEDGFIQFLTFVVKNFNPQYCVFLSGDVHYGFTMEANFTIFDPEGQSPMPLVQLTSSALKSSSLAGKLLISGFLGLVHRLFVPSQTVRFGWSGIGNGEMQYADAQRNILSPSGSKKGKNVKEENKRILSSSIPLGLNRAAIPNNISPRYPTNKQPDWIERRSLVYNRGRGTSPILSDNNIGVVGIDASIRTINHRLLVRHNGSTRVWKATVTTKTGS